MRHGEPAKTASHDADQAKGARQTQKIPPRYLSLRGCCVNATRRRRGDGGVAGRKGVLDDRGGRRCRWSVGQEQKLQKVYETTACADEAKEMQDGPEGRKMEDRRKQAATGRSRGISRRVRPAWLGMGVLVAFQQLAGRRAALAQSLVPGFCWLPGVRTCSLGSGTQRAGIYHPAMYSSGLVEWRLPLWSSPGQEPPPPGPCAS